MAVAALTYEALVMAEEKPATSTARVDTELLEMARLVVAHRRKKGQRPWQLTDYLNELLRKPITEEYRKVQKEIAAESDAGS